MNTLLFIFIAIFVASVFQTITGFGIAVMLVPLLLHFYPVRISSLYGLEFTVISCLFTITYAHRSINFHLIKNMFLASIPGIVVGLFIIQGGNEVCLKKIIGLLTLSIAVALLFGFKKPIKNEKKASVVVGFISGILSSSFGMPGPPVTLFGVNQAYSKGIFRASLSAYFFLVSVTSLVLMQFRFNYPAAVYLGSFKFIISLVAGFLVGNILFKYVSERMIYQSALVLTAVVGLSVIV